MAAIKIPKINTIFIGAYHSQSQKSNDFFNAIDSNMAGDTDKLKPLMFTGDTNINICKKYDPNNIKLMHFSLEHSLKIHDKPFTKITADA